MTGPAALVAFAMLVAAVGANLLPRATWTHLSPRWGIYAWLTLTMTVSSALLLTGLTLAAPALPISAPLAHALDTTPLHVTDHYSTPAGASLAVLALVITTVATGATLLAFLGNVHQAARQRRRHIEALSLIGTPHAAGFTLVEHDSPLVYCLPGRRRTVVVTRAALDALSSDELHWVLAHERRHLRERHDLALALSTALAQVFGRLSVFRIAHQQVSMLVEMQADDAARSSTDRRAMASALLTLSGHSRASAEVTFGGTNSAVRVRRLIDPDPTQVSWGQRLLIGVASAVLLATPIGLALAPAVGTAVEAALHPSI